MFVAWRDLRAAKGRFALMGGVVVLMTLLVTLLSGLTAGLGRESTSGIADLPADHLAFAAPAGDQDVSFSDSAVTADQWRAWGEVPGVTAAEPLSIATTKATGGERTGDDVARSAAVSVFGVTGGSSLLPDGARVGDGSVVLSTGAAEDLGVAAGDDLQLAGRDVVVADVADDASYSHTPVVWASLDDAARLEPGGPAGADRSATVIALSTDGGDGPDDAALTAADQRLGTTTVTTSDSLQAIGSYASENGSLQLMRGMLFGISALVIGAFFTVWTIQRSGDIAVLKALGATTRYLMKDAIGQALVLLVAGTALGASIAAAIGAAAAGTVPFALTASTMLAPPLVLIVLGALGAVLSVRRITSVDPLTALGSAR